jgi:hypothetical protein
MKWTQLVPSLVDHFRPGDDPEVTPYRRTGATSLKNEVIATCCTDAPFRTIETEILFQLLMRVRADQSRLDGCCQPPQAYLGW